jgi:phospholipase/lecithinase/hemolysin
VRPIHLYLFPAGEHIGAVKSLVRLIALVWLSASVVLPAQAAFSSLYAFGDGVCSSTDGPGDANYYPDTYSNGRIWIQVLAQRQGVTYSASKNLSYFYHLSSDVVTDASGFSASDATTSLFVVWVNDADFVDDMTYIYPSQDLPTWNNAVSSSLARHSQIIQTLYAKGARTFIMPNAVDISKIPYYSGLSSGYKGFIRQRIVYFNTGFATALNQARASLPGIKIYMPDMFALLDNMAANPAGYGFINATGNAIGDGYTSLTGPGANYLFWDPWDPTARAHAVVADTIQQMISPVRISNLTSLNGSNRLDLANVPIGLNGFVDGRANVVSGNWTSATNINSTSATQTIFVPASGPQRFYRLRFPFAWSWP